jgi:hypothetical protein
MDRNGFKFTKPKEYVGDRDAVQIENWIYSVTEYIAWNQLQGEDSIRVAATFLGGPALQYWIRVRHSDDYPVIVANGIAAFCGLIRDQFYPPEHIDHVRKQLYKLNFW